ncbi:carbohydrate sulfotransferase 13-like isoform X2 [Dreissena polymorpha]|uniref:carbohydrate sulfotransferase 13-like isoform X2 n=1 Tax=Dreissena polymorpha TaxID=45954 RepID=UPI0022655EEE|nr:carbohydrate sulfotransferase 13-like isoform X2 [Dreissena polymorpha]
MRDNEWTSNFPKAAASKGMKRRTTGSNGYALAQMVRQRCIQKGHNFNVTDVHVSLLYTSSEPRVDYCPLWKVGTTFLKRVFMIKNLELYSNITNPYDISFLQTYNAHRGAIITNSQASQKFVFVRDPYQRLLSTYIDKIHAPNSIYWKRIGIPAIKKVRSNASIHSLNCGHDLTFEEFIKYVAKVMPRYERAPSRQKLGVKDYHFEKYTILCKPCKIEYDFVGKMESFAEDSLELVKQLNMPKIAELMIVNGSNIYVDDAIKDTAFQPFSPEFNNDVTRCMSKKTALERVWTKLQFRGLIGNTKLLLDEKRLSSMTYPEFLQIVMDARKKSDSSERNQLKKRLFRETYKSVNLEDLYKVSAIFQDDFDLFEYDRNPSRLFQ